MAIRPMTANDALQNMRGKLEGRGLPPGLIPAILEAIIGLFASFCPTLAPGPQALKKIAADGYKCCNDGEMTVARLHLRRRIRRHIGLRNLQHLDACEKACWEVAYEADEQEVARYSAVWQAEGQSVVSDEE